MIRKTLLNSVWALGLSLLLATANTAQATSAELCDAYARDYAQRNSRQGQVIGHGAVGSLLGAGIGAAFGGAAVGAAIGGGLGMIGGGARRQQTADRMYHSAYQECMSGRVR